MPKPIFVKTGAHYWDCGDEECYKNHSMSYTDFWELVRLAEFKVCTLDEVKWDSKKTYIVPLINGEFPDKFPERTNKMIHWLLERPSEGLQCDERFDETWVSDKYFNSILPGSKYVTLGTDWRLRKTWSKVILPKIYDFIHLSYLTDRRKRFVNHLLDKGFTIAPNGWANTRELNLLQSKAMLSVHQDDWPVIEPLRYALASPFALPILAEKKGAEDYYPWQVDEDAPKFDSLGLTWLKPKNPTDEDYQFKKLVLEAVQ